MTENKGQGKALDTEQPPSGKTTNETNTERNEEKGPTEKLLDQRKPEAEHLVPGVEVPGAQNPESESTKKEINPNTE